MPDVELQPFARKLDSLDAVHQEIRQKLGDLVDGDEERLKKFAEKAYRRRDDGYYYLHAEDAANLENALARTKSDLDASRRRATELESKLRGYGDLTPDQIQKLQQERRELEDKIRALETGKPNEEIEEEVLRRIDRFKQDHKTQLEASLKAKREADEKLEKLQRDFDEAVIGGELRRAAAKAGAFDEAWDDIVRDGLATYRRNPETGKVEPRDENGNLITGKDAESLLSYEEWVDSDKKRHRHRYPAKSGTGSTGSELGAGGGPGADDALLKLPAEARLAKIRTEQARQRQAS